MRRLLALVGPAARVVDVGAGTGHLAEPLARAGARVVAVEPASAMLAVCAERVRGLPVGLVCAPAEATGLPDSSADLVVLADAAQWVDPEAAGRETARLLVASGTAAAVEPRPADTPFMHELERLLREANPERRPQGPGRARQWLALASGGASVRAVEMPHAVELTPEALDAVLRSLSFLAPALGPGRRWTPSSRRRSDSPSDTAARAGNASYVSLGPSAARVDASTDGRAGSCGVPRGWEVRKGARQGHVRFSREAGHSVRGPWYVSLLVPIALTDPIHSPEAPRWPWERWVLRLMNDERDLPFVRLCMKLFFLNLPVAALLYVPGVYRWWLGALYFVVSSALFLGPFILMLHNTSHRPLFKREYRLLNLVVPWALGPFFGETPDSYFAHHVGMHHAENNLAGDLSSTLRFRRDSLPHFLRYFGRFFFLGWVELTRYHWSKRRFKMLRRFWMGELSFYALVAVLGWWNFYPTLWVFIVPYVFTRVMMMCGNWAQHAFVDLSMPESPYRNSITCVELRLQPEVLQRRLPHWPPREAHHALDGDAGRLPEERRPLPRGERHRLPEARLLQHLGAVDGPPVPLVVALLRRAGPGPAQDSAGDCRAAALADAGPGLKR